ncbi:astacin [Teladorsagia circumcincta]|uniref:Astacin n=1 Tax=Teladorsagia circumcincta TaxID=45464 RepID=A0A2G9TUS8_TELCI|nr:astacin [Teladorsagia circumcincta]
MNPKTYQAVATVASLFLLLDGVLGLSDDGRTSLIRALRGIDLDERFERLRSLRVVDLDQRSSLAATPMNTTEHGPTEASDGFGGGSIIEKNRLEGVDEYLFEGDINLTEEQLSALEASLNNHTSRRKRQASKTATLWANKKVFYYFDPSFVDLTNVPTENQHNYNKLAATESINYTPYEYGSVMHYDTRSFATSGQSLVPKTPRYLYTMGSQQISFYDIFLINSHYKCHGICAAKGAACVNGGKRNPKNCAVCICPAGYGGALCNLRPAGCGAVVTAGPTWKSKVVTLGHATNMGLRDTYAMCNDWIKVCWSILFRNKTRRTSYDSF